MAKPKQQITVREYLRKMMEISGGHGLYGHECRRPEFWLAAGADPYDLVKAVDEETVAAANKRGWDLAKLCEFADSRAGRHCGDAMSRVVSCTTTVVTIDSCLRNYIAIFEKESK